MNGDGDADVHLFVNSKRAARLQRSSVRTDDDGYMYSLYAEKENFMYSGRVPALPWDKFKPLTTFENYEYMSYRYILCF